MRFLAAWPRDGAHGTLVLEAKPLQEGVSETRKLAVTPGVNGLPTTGGLTARPEASIIVPCWRARSTVDTCLAHLLGLEGLGRYEVLLVDNGSDDGTLEVLQQYAASHSSIFRVLLETRPGSYAARNRGVEDARGEVLLFTDADCCPEPSWARSLVAALTDPTCRIAGGDIVGTQGSRTLVERYSDRAAILSQHHTLRHSRGPFLQTANLAVRREDALSVRFDPELMSSGDADFCYRLVAARPGAIRLVENARVRHAHRTTVRGLFRQFRRYGEGEVDLASRYGRDPGRWWRRGGDAVRVGLVPLLGLLALPVALVRRDPVIAVAPWLRVVRIVGRRVGRARARLGRARHRS